MKSVVFSLILNLLALPALSASDLSETRVALLGDSMTWIGGDSCRNERGWTRPFADMTSPKSIAMYARSGATWANTSRTVADTSDYSEVLSDRNVIFNQALRLLENSEADPASAPDLILIYAGANDVWFHDRRPGIFAINDKDITPLPEDLRTADPASATSLAGSVELVCRMLSHALPEAEIVLMTPVEMSKAPAAMTERVSSIIAATGERLGLRVLRADRDVPIRHETERRRPTMTSDGVHTNPGGALLIGCYVTRNLSGSRIN